MKSLSKLVRSRLTSQQILYAEHPVADQLAGFFEGGLSSRERAALLEHLAQCFECREVVALTTSVERREVVSVPGVREQRSVWWALCGAAAVGCLALTVIPLPQFFPPASKPVLSSKNVLQGAVVGAQIHPQRLSPIPAATYQGNIPERSRHAIAEAQKNTVNYFPVPSQLQGFAPNSVVSRPVSGFRDEIVWSILMPNGESLGRGGTVQKSENGGRSWESVRVDDRSRLYAVSATGSTVWAGGADGALFRSDDDGTDWTPIMALDHEMRLTGTITEIEARDERVMLKVKGGTQWLTVDGGLHWRWK